MASQENIALRLASVIQLQDVDGIANSVWTYEISWTQSTSWLARFAFPTDLAPRLRLGLELSRRISIQDPARFPSIASIQQTRVLVPAKGAVQYVYADFDPASEGPGVLSFVAPTQPDDFTAVMLVHQPAVETPWTPLSFTTGAEGDVALRHIVTGPAVVCTGSEGGPPPGLLPYATELFGTFQPLIGWVGQLGGSLFAGHIPGAFATTASTSPSAEAPAQLGILSPVGLIDLFREYFFEVDTFLGVPVGHIWLSPGGTVELIEVSTRKTTIEQTTEQSVETTNKTESNLTQQDDIADATKEDNQTNTKLGVSATESGGFKPIIEGSASQSFSIDNTVHSSQEQSHKHSRTQSEKVSGEIRRNFKTTFRTVTETTDTTSRRYVVQNTTNKLVNYELRRKMRKIAVQVQHIGTQLCWQAYLDDPGRLLGMGAMVHVATPSAATSAMTPPDPLAPKETSFKAHFPWMPFSTDHAGDYAGADTFYRNAGDRIAERNEFNGKTLERYDADHSDPIKLTGATIYSEYAYTAVVPAPGYRLTGVRIGKADKPVWAVPKILDADRGVFALHIVNAHPSGDAGLDFDELTLRWDPPATDPALADFQNRLVEAHRVDFANAIRDRLKLVSSLRPRHSEDLRSEEKHLVYGKMIERLTEKLSIGIRHEVVAELVRGIFDVDEMLYFVAPDFWKPRLLPDDDPGDPKYLPPLKPSDPNPFSLDNNLVAGWYGWPVKNLNYDSSGGEVSESRVDYLITEETQPAPMGSSLGWLIQVDGDERRNEFLNAAWVKAVFPVRPGKELDALAFLKATNVEGEQGLGAIYNLQPGDPPEWAGLSIGDVLDRLAEQLRVSNTDIRNTLATEKVFENGFDPLEGGFRVAKPYEVFDQWIEVLPTDQVVAVDYDPTRHGA